MSPIVIVGLLALLGLWFWAMNRRVHQEHKWNQMWSSAAAKLGLKFQLTRSGRMLYGSIEGVAVQAEHSEVPLMLASPAGSVSCNGTCGMGMSPTMIAR